MTIKNILKSYKEILKKYEHQSYLLSLKQLNLDLFNNKYKCYTPKQFYLQIANQYNINKDELNKELEKLWKEKNDSKNLVLGYQKKPYQPYEIFYEGFKTYLKSFNPISCNFNTLLRNFDACGFAAYRVAKLCFSNEEKFWPQIYFSNLCYENGWDKSKVEKDFRDLFESITNFRGVTDSSIKKLKKEEESIGTKDSSNKLMTYEIDANFIQDMAKVMSVNKIENGGKYERLNYLKPINPILLLESIGRHYLELVAHFQEGNITDLQDPDGSGSILTKIAVNSMMLSVQLRLFK